jgi:hypothetical protein
MPDSKRRGDDDVYASRQLEIVLLGFGYGRRHKKQLLRREAACT